MAGRPGWLAQQGAESSAQGEEFGSPLLTEGRIDAGEVEFVGGRQLSEVPAQLRLRNTGTAGEPVAEGGVGIRERRIGGLPVARGVEVHDAFGLDADRRCEFVAAVQGQQCGGEAVGAVERMAQARKLEGGACLPYGELLLDALEVREESAARMGDLCGAEFAQGEFD